MNDMTVTRRDGADAKKSAERVVQNQDDWVDSEFFKEWLRLAREGQQNHKN